MDPVVHQLRALAATEAMRGDVLRAELAATMLELYLVGRIDVTFDAQGEPTATLIDHPAPLVHAPMFAPSLLLDGGDQKEENKRRIGFTVN